MCHPGKFCSIKLVVWSTELKSRNMYSRKDQGSWYDVEAQGRVQRREGSAEG